MYPGGGFGGGYPGPQQSSNPYPSHGTGGVYPYPQMFSPIIGGNDRALLRQENSGIQINQIILSTQLRKIKVPKLDLSYLFQTLPAEFQKSVKALLSASIVYY